jgi:hypothetical protein
MGVGFVKIMYESKMRCFYLVYIHAFLLFGIDVGG